MLTAGQQRWMALSRSCDRLKLPQPPTFSMTPLLRGPTKRLMLAHIEDLTDHDEQCTDG